MIEAVIFDCDGVLVDSEVLALEVELAILAEIGLHYEPRDFKARFMGMSNRAFFAALDQDHRRLLGRPLPDDFSEKCKARYRASWHRLAEVPGARAAIAQIAGPKAVASSSEEDALERKLRHTNLWALFAPHVYSADRVAHAKPAPDLFLCAADGLKMAPGRCLAIEDSLNGVASAHAAGMTVWGFLGGGHADEHTGPALLAAGAERLLRNWSEIRDALGARS